MAKPLLATKLGAWSKGKLWVKTNLLTSVIFTLVMTWVGISWAVYYLEDPVKDSNIHSFQDGLWWGIVTFLTVGYGDKYPITGSGRVFAALLMVVGVVTMSILTAKISTYFLEQALAKGRKTVDTARLKQHFVICGWKEDMEDLLEHILTCNPDMQPKDIVVVAHMNETLVDGLKQHPTLSEVQLVIGDYIHESVLKRAAPERARRILILADQTHVDGKLPSESEVDARTIMAAMTLSQIARGTLVAAEIYDPKMDHYLKIANVSEVIYTREYSRLILGNATVGAGIANVMYEILSPSTTVKIITATIPDALVGKTYGEIKRGWTQYYGAGSLLLGVIENTGNSDTVRQRALRNAQKTANMKDLVSNLKGVKSLRFNHPVFSPPNDYVVHEGSLAITLENKVLEEAKNERAGEKAA